jgi:hypothetical protein
MSAGHAVEVRAERRKGVVFVSEGLIAVMLGEEGRASVHEGEEFDSK